MVAVAGYSTLRPEAQRSRKGFVHRLLGRSKSPSKRIRVARIRPNPRDKESSNSRIWHVFVGGSSDATATQQNSYRNNLANGGFMQSAQVVTRNLDNRTLLG
jgi:hypothetical protein